LSPANFIWKLTGCHFGGKIILMGEGERLTCPKCGANLTLALPPDGMGGRTFQCFDCDRPDPLKTEKAMRWLKSELQPPT